MKKNNTQNEKGFTLLEVLVAAAIGLLMLTSIYTIFLSQSQSTVRTEAVADLTAQVNVSSNLLSNDLLVAGYGGTDWLKGMGIFPINNFGTDFMAAEFHANTRPVNAGANLRASLAGDIKPNTDAIMIVYADPNYPDGNEVHNSSSPTNAQTLTNIRLCQPNMFNSGGDPVVAGDVGMFIGPGDQTFMVKVTNVDNAASGASICSGAAAYTEVDFDGLDEVILPYFEDCAGAACVNSKFFKILGAYIYYVDNSDNFKRLPIDSQFAPQIITEGVEDLQFRYNLTNTCNQVDGAGTTYAYWGAGCFGVNGPGGIPPQNASLEPEWQLLENIRSVQFAFEFRSINPDNLGYKDLGRQIDLANFDDPAPPTTPDSFRRRVATQTVLIKNLELLDFGS